MSQAPDSVKYAKSNAKKVALICVLLALPAAIYFIYFGFDPENGISMHGRIALILGVIFAFFSAFLFMGIIFFSARSGADEQPNYVKLAEDEKERARSAFKR